MSDEADTSDRAAAPETGAVSERAAPVTPAPRPTPVVPLAESSTVHPPGTAAPTAVVPVAVEPADRPDVIGPPDKPELAVGAAFAGGFVLAFLLKKITS